MAEDNYLVETAWWLQYYEQAREYIQQARAAMISEPPQQEILDDPQAFNQWLEQCERIYLARATNL